MKNKSGTSIDKTTTTSQTTGLSGLNIGSIFSGISALKAGSAAAGTVK